MMMASVSDSVLGPGGRATRVYESQSRCAVVTSSGPGSGHGAVTGTVALGERDSERERDSEPETDSERD